MRVSDFYALGRTQPFLDFVDVPLDTDINVFFDPVALRSYRSHWASECQSLLQHYFAAVLRHIKNGSHEDARRLLSCLSERNEFHLGYSRGPSRGHGFGTDSAASVWTALTESQAAKSGLLEDLEDTCLMIDGIGRDMISDAVCNILRGPLVAYTQDICEFYDIPLTPDVASGPIWDPESEKWEARLLPLPVTSFGPVVLVPKVFVRHRLSYESEEYFTHYLLPEMQKDELKANTGLVEVLSDGRRRVTKKALKEKYGADKLTILRETLKRPSVLDQYRESVRRSSVPPLDNEQWSEIEHTPPPSWASLIAELRALPPGRENAKQYEDLIERILTALFYPSLCMPRKQHEIHDGRKRIDLTYTNEAAEGFFGWLARNYCAPYVFVECKNYGKEVGNPEIDQLAGRFSRSRGQVGILVVRSVDDMPLLQSRCKDTAQDDRGFIVTLTDSDIERLAVEMQEAATNARNEYALLRERFRELVD